MKQNQNNCHSELYLQSLSHEESQKSQILRMQIQRSHSQNDRALVGADSISARQRGITLIALVVTLVVLLILAGVTINIMLSEGGIIAKAQSSKEKQEVGVWLDRLTVTEANTAVTHYAVDMEKYNAQLKAEGIVLENNSNYQSEDGGKTYNLTTDNGYVFNISEPTPGDIVINYIGKNGELLPFIKEIKVISTTTNSSKIEVDVARLEDGKLTYEYKKHAEESYTLLKENKELTADFIGLTQNETYDIKVTAENKNGKSEAKIISIYTGELQEGTISQKGETVWSNNQASIELQTTDTTNTMQYQKNDITGTWTNYTTVITGLVHGDIVYARMFDGVNGTSPFSISIMDGIAPTVTITNSSNTTNSVTVTANSTDAQSGMVASPTYTFYRKVSTEADANYIKDQESTNATYTKAGLLQNTTYTIKVETKDKANNIGSVTKNITTSGVGGATGGLTEGNVIASSPIWSNGTASITLSTITGLTIQWQKNAINSNSWTTGTSATGLNHGDTLYARLTDGTNYGDSASVSILDGTIPQTATINLSKTTTEPNAAITATVTQIDNESGIDITKCKWVYNNTSGLIGTEESSYIGGTFSSNPQAISLNASTEGTYYLHVLTIDKAGNKKESVSTPVTVEKKLVADGSYSDEKGVNTPKLGAGMTPVKWDGSTFITTTPDDKEWYSYTNKQWANAITTDGSYWVWIPRYAYQIASNYHNGGNGVSGTINIEFMKGTTNVSSSGRSSFNNSTGQGNWNIHPAFNYGSEVSGIWVAKYEASQSDAGANTANYQYYTGGTSGVIKIQSSVNSWRNISVNDIYNTCLNYNTTLNSHQMKNTEWGAVAYLSKSKYGKENLEVGVNECNQYITGMGPGGSSDVYNGVYGYSANYTYNTTQGQKASTTGNIYGVYDMSGGSYEYTAAYVNNRNESLQSYGASLVNTGVTKNKDVYGYNASRGDDYRYNLIANSNRYGDALYETSVGEKGFNADSWFGDDSWFPYTNVPFFRRGGDVGTSLNSGVFAFYINGGVASSSIGFRPILVVL